MLDKALFTYLEEFVTPVRRQKFKDILNKRTKHFTVVLEDVYQMHNTSAVIRSCDVFGVQQAHAIEVQHKNVLDKEIAMGAQKWVDLKYHSNTETCIGALKEQGYQIIATTPHNDSCLVEDFDVTKKSAFVFGVEKEGVSDMMLEQADAHLKVPMYGFTESFNISVSAAICLSELTTKMREQDIDWQLSKSEQERVLLKWLKQSIKKGEKIAEEYEAKRKV